MSALDPSAPGLPLAGGVGGGASLPTTLAGALLDVPNADRIVVLDEFGVGAAVTGAQLSAVLAATRRGALSIPLLWECNEPSGPALNTGTLGASGNLATIGSGVTRAARGVSTLGQGTRFDGTSNGRIRGATGVDTGSTSALTLFAIATVEAWPGARKSLITRAYTTSYTYAPYLSCGLVVAPGGTWLVEIARPGYTEFTASRAYTLGQQHIFGLTYDGTTLRAWLDGAPAGSTTVAGAIDWGAGDGDWWLASNPGNEASACLISRAGAAAAVWGQDEWAELWQRTNGCWVG